MASSEEVKAPAGPAKKTASEVGPTLRLVGKELHEGGAYDHNKGRWRGGRLVQAFPTKKDALRFLQKRKTKDRAGAREAMLAAKGAAAFEKAAELMRKAGL